MTLLLAMQPGKRSSDPGHGQAASLQQKHGGPEEAAGRCGQAQQRCGRHPGPQGRPPQPPQACLTAVAPAFTCYSSWLLELRVAEACLPVTRISTAYLGKASEKPAWAEGSSIWSFVPRDATMPACSSYTACHLCAGAQCSAGEQVWVAQDCERWRDCGQGGGAGGPRGEHRR